MPKRIGHLCEKMLDRNLIRKVIIEGSKGKRKRHDVKKVLSDVEKYTDKVYEILKCGTYVPTDPRHITILDTCSVKKRTIGVVPYYPDGIIHRLIVEVARPIFMRGMYAHSCASIPGRGNMHAIKYMKKAMKDVKGSKYCTKMDIRHYYPNISHEKMMDVLRRKIKDERFLGLIRKIITSDGAGLTIGFYLNQWLANVFLESLDQMITTCDGVKYYVRNMDDLVLIGPNKKKLHKAIRAVAKHLGSLGLELKKNWQVFRVDDRGVDFVGYRFFHGYTLLRKRNYLKLVRQCRRVKRKIEAGKTLSVREAAGLLSRVGQLKHCSGVNIRKKYFDDIKAKRLKNIIRANSKRIKDGNKL